jgi:ribonuclease HII
VLDDAAVPTGLADSKTLAAPVREAVAADIEARALAWSVAFVDCNEIDRLNILNATLLAMQRAVAGLPLRPAMVLVDGNRCPDNLGCPSRAVVKGDRRVPAISAASILAKVARDREMLRLDGLYPGYGFKQHKGYHTPAHLAAIQRLGPCPVHRRSFAPVRAMVAEGRGLTAS